MSESNKRRRTSPDTYVTVADQENAETVNSRPTTPKRNSYQSPTKASLARSNPTALQLLDQAKQRRESEPNRRQSLRDAVLGSNPNQQAQRTPGQQPQALDDSRSASQRRADTETWIENSFKDIPQADPAPLIPTPKRPYHPPIPSSAIVPRLVKSNTTISSEREKRSTSIELPPTPVQLGKENAPERPRGLLTSSPGGSGRRRVRVRHGSIHSSPLKPRELAPAIAEEEEEDHEEIASGISEEPDDLPANSGGTPELDFVRDDIVNTIEGDMEEDLEDEIPDEESRPELLIEAQVEQVRHVEQDDDPVVQEKVRKLKAFQEQLQALKKKCSDLEALSKKFDANDMSEDPVEKLRAAELLLASYEDLPRRQVPQPEDKEIFKRNAAKYLTSFAPRGLQMSYETWEKNVKGSQKFVYQTSIAAPACWPRSTLLTTFDVVVDLEAEKVEAVRYLPGTTAPRSLTKWIERKTADPLSKHDVATISMGVSAYFHEATTRAKIFKHLEHARDDEELLKSKLALDVPVTDSAEASSLCRYIAQDSFISQLGDASLTKTRRSLGSAKQIILIYEIKLDWIGNAFMSIDIAGSNLSDTAMESAKKLFKEKLHVDGVVSAFSAVKSILEASSQEDGRGTGTAKGKGKKPRRMTAAEFV